MGAVVRPGQGRCSVSDTDAMVRAYTAAGYEVAAAGGDRRAAVVAYVGAAAAGAWWSRVNGLPLMDAVAEQVTADPLAAAAAKLFTPDALAALIRWVDAVWPTVQAAAESLLAADAAAGRVADDHWVRSPSVARAAAQAKALGDPNCDIADAVVCGALAEAKTLRELGYHGCGSDPAVYAVVLMEPLVATAAAEAGVARCAALAVWIEGQWPDVYEHASRLYGLQLWEEEVMG